MGSIVITRRVGERILIAHGVIEIQVIDLFQGRTRLRITAPDDIPVERPEREQDRLDREEHRLRSHYMEGK